MSQKNPISFASVRSYLRLFGLSKDAKIEPVITTGNISFIVTDRDEKFFLRLSPSGRRARSVDEIRAEINLLKHVARQDFPVILPLAMNDGREVISIGEHHGYLRPFIEARIKSKPSISNVYEFGIILGRYHRLIDGYRPSHSRDHRFDFYSTRKHWREVRSEVLESDIDASVKFVDGFEKEMDRLHFPSHLPRGFIHEDLGKRHVLWRGNEISAVLDFDRSYYGPLVLDIGQAVRGWCFVDDWRRFSARHVKSLLAGYGSQHRLVSAEKNCLVDSIKFAILERAQSFFLRAVFGEKKEGEIKFALDCVIKQVPLVEKNRKTVQSLMV